MSDRRRKWALQSKEAKIKHNLLPNLGSNINPFKMIKHRLVSDLEPRLKNREYPAAGRCLTNIIDWLDAQIKRDLWVRRKKRKPAKKKKKLKKSIITRYTG